MQMKKLNSKILEISTDGRNFNVLTETDKDSRSYIYKPAKAGTAQYRLKVYV